jgi:DNA-binding NarL/FixJ family response regulator
MAAPILSQPSFESSESPAAALARIVEGARALESAAEGALRERATALRTEVEAALLRLLPPPPRMPLSRREREVLQLMAKGLGNLETARVLSRSLGTVRTHIEHIFRKLEVTNRVEAVTEGIRLGLVDP